MRGGGAEMSENILLSVIVPVYNVEKYLPAALDSLLAAGADVPLEILAADDGSSDGSPRILEEYAEKDGRVRIIGAGGGGVSHVRNLCLAEAKGKYITFADSDDTVEPGFFAEAVREMEENGYDLVQGDARFVAEDGQVLKTLPGCGRRASADPAELLEWFYGRDQALLFSVWGKVYRREIVADVRFPEGIRIAEDQRYLFDALKKHPKELILDTPAYNYAVRESSVMQAGYAEKGWDAIRVLEGIETEAGDPQIRRYIDKQKTDIWVRIYNTAKLNGKDTGKALEAIRAADIREIRNELTKKERVKLVLLQHCPALYDILLKTVG